MLLSVHATNQITSIHGFVIKLVELIFRQFLPNTIWVNLKPIYAVVSSCKKSEKFHALLFHKT